MSVATAIGRVSESLRELLIGEVAIVGNLNVSLIAPDESPTGGGSGPRINLFLYKVLENTYMRNMDWQLKQGTVNELTPAPLSLNLFYLMTPYATSGDSNTRNITAQEVLGDAMRVFHENPIFDVDDGYLAEELTTAREQIKIMPSQLDMDELSKIWSTFSEPFRLSVPYEVSVVQIDQSGDKEKIMAQRVRHIGVPEIRAPYQPPVLDLMSPEMGSAGSAVTFTGEQLDGWKAYVTSGRRNIASGLDISGNSFTISLPGDLAPGFHQIRVDISRLFRKTFFFEVT